MRSVPASCGRNGSSTPASSDATETTAYVGRAVVALAQDPDILQRTGQALFVADLALDYGFTDQDGTQPATFIT
ncbi:hypothetical protein [Exiguobacterium sp.]|uniref:hypothetical protein n=1 Tax=Exiguobacterium sp. TaxID=44751 RepID=UPI0025BDE82C|nr:hypothetical protein [Exiguobacterium sp.]